MVKSTDLHGVMLVVPAALLWSERRLAQNSRHLFYFSPSFVSLVCLLALLFPVVSATDDTQAMRGEVEESSHSKRVVKQLASSQDSTWANAGGSPARLTQEMSFQSGRESAEEFQNTCLSSLSNLQSLRLVVGLLPHPKVLSLCCVVISGASFPYVAELDFTSLRLVDSPRIAA